MDRGTTAPLTDSWRVAKQQSDEIPKWYQENKMAINAEKTKIMILIPVKSYGLVVLENIKYLCC